MYYEGKISGTRETSTTSGDARVVKRDDSIYVVANRFLNFVGVCVC